LGGGGAGDVVLGGGIVGTWTGPAAPAAAPFPQAAPLEQIIFTVVFL